MNFHKNHWLLFGVTFFGFVGLSLIVGILPAIWVQNNAEPLPGAEPLTTLQREGLGVYVSEGCVACHTQQVRPLAVDQAWGRPATAGDYAYVTPLGPLVPYAPAVLGSERTGPDLTNVGARQASDVWQYIHLYNPRSVVPDSVMPAYPWLFDEVTVAAAGQTVVPVPAAFAPKNGSQVVPNARGMALVAYLLSLKQTPLGAATATPPGADTAAQAPTQPVADTAAQTAAPAAAPVLAWDESLGASTYTGTCAACHQANGQGLPGAFPPLAGDPVVTADDPTEHITVVLAGKQGGEIGGTTYASPMPAQAQLSDEQVAAVINHERTSWGNAATLVTPEEVAAVRGGLQ